MVSDSIAMSSPKARLKRREKSKYELEEKDIPFFILVLLIKLLSRSEIREKICLCYMILFKAILFKNFLEKIWGPYLVDFSQ